MRPPSKMGVIQIDITNRCNGPQCSNCTRMLAHHWRKFVMAPANFVAALTSLKDFPGVVGVFGGNPCMLEDFPWFCHTITRLRPQKHLRGLWTNSFGPHEALARETFGYINFNAHGGPGGVFTYKLWPDGRETTTRADSPHSYHCPSMVAIRDVIQDEGLMWDLIDKCPVQNRWSACITEIDGAPLVYFCEVAAAWEHVYGPETGIHLSTATLDWWRRPLEFFRLQKQRWCPVCGMALPLPARKDVASTDDVSATHLAVCAEGRHIEAFNPAGYSLERNLARWGDPLDYGLLRTSAEDRNLSQEE